MIAHILNSQTVRETGRARDRKRKSEDPSARVRRVLFR